jgi:hypothetical protein
MEEFVARGFNSKKAYDILKLGQKEALLNASLKWRVKNRYITTDILDPFIDTQVPTHDLLSILNELALNPHYGKADKEGLKHRINSLSLISSFSGFCIAIYYTYLIAPLFLIPIISSLILLISSRRNHTRYIRRVMSMRVKREKLELQTQQQFYTEMYAEKRNI